MSTSANTTDGAVKMKSYLTICRLPEVSSADDDADEAEDASFLFRHVSSAL